MNSINKKQKPEIHPAADADIDHLFEWLKVKGCSGETLVKFLDAVEEAKAKIKDNPETWSKVSGSIKVRKVQVRSFRITVFYLVRKNKVPLILEFAGPGLVPRWANRLG
jgi:hypothetical protein